MNRGIKIIIIAVLFFLGSGCATIYNPATEKNELIFINTAAEVSLGQRADLQVRSQNKISKDAELKGRLERIAKNIAAVSDRKDLTYHFSVIEGKEINAFATPGGYIYVFSALMQKTTDDELACVIAHEVGHVAARHIVKKLQTEMGYEILMSFAFGGGKAADMERAINFTFNMISLGYSREDELEADKLGLKYAYLSGYDPWAMLSFLKKLQAMEKEGMPEIFTIFRTHPALPQRIDRLMQLLENYPQRSLLNKFCPQCGRRYREQIRFCTEDGTELQYKGK